jgi:hypothetical protein
MSYPISEAEGLQTPTSPVKSPHLHTGKVKLPKPPEQITPCETTMIPYLEQLFAAEVEDDLAKTGRILSIGSLNDDPEGWLSNHKSIHSFS